MRATLRDDGTLVLIPESGIEAYAARAWTLGERKAEVAERKQAEDSETVPRRSSRGFAAALREMGVGETVYFEPNGTAHMRGSIWQAAKNAGVSITTKARDGGIEATRTA